MTERDNDRRLSRRAALAGTALALGAATAAIAGRRAAAQEQEKISQTLATYRAMPNGSDHCGICSNFQPPNACRFVQGEISPDGWCQLFAPRSATG